MGLVFFFGALHIARDIYRSFDASTAEGSIAEVQTSNFLHATRRRGYRSAVYIRLQGYDEFFVVPRDMFTTPSEDAIRAANHATIAYDKHLRSAFSIRPASMSIPHTTRDKEGRFHTEYPSNKGGVPYYGARAITLDDKPYLTPWSYRVEMGLRGILLLGLGVFSAVTAWMLNRRQPHSGK